MPMVRSTVLHVDLLIWFHSELFSDNFIRFLVQVWIEILFFNLLRKIAVRERPKLFQSGFLGKTDQLFSISIYSRQNKYKYTVWEWMLRAGDKVDWGKRKCLPQIAVNVAKNARMNDWGKFLTNEQWSGLNCLLSFL